MTRAEIFQCDLERLIAEYLGCEGPVMGEAYARYAQSVTEVLEATHADSDESQEHLATLCKALYRFHAAVARMAGA